MSEQAFIPVDALDGGVAGNVSTGPSAGASVVLQRGQWWMARGPHRVSVLTDCGVAVVWWSPSALLGAVCHCDQPQGAAVAGLSAAEAARAVPEALDTLARSFAQHGGNMDDLELTVVGGASAASDTLGADNVASVLRWMADHGLRARQMDVGGRVLRRLTVNLSDGSLCVAHGARLNPGEV